MSSTSGKGRKSKGRQKVAMVKMSNDQNLQVTFSKRRSGLFKKASELCTLCGAEVAIVVFSPGKKVFSFGHPSVESVVQRFLTREPPQVSSHTHLVEAYHKARLHERNMELTQVLHELEKEKKNGEELNKMRKNSQAQNWYEAPIESLSMPQLEKLKFHMEELKKNVTKQIEKLMIQNSNPPPQFFPGSYPSGDFNLPFEQKNIAAGFNPTMMPPPAFNPGFGARFF